MRQSVHERAVTAANGGKLRCLFEEPVWKYLGQCYDRELLLVAQDLADRQKDLLDTRRRKGGSVRPHRAILQYGGQTIDERLRQPGRV